MSQILQNWLIGQPKKELSAKAEQYEIDAFVAHKRRTVLVQQFKHVLQKPAVLVGIFGAGVIKETIPGKNDPQKDDRASKSTIFANIYRIISLYALGRE